MIFPGKPSLLRDALLIAVVGIGFALVANAVSPRGLSLRRDYFPAVAVTKPASGPVTGSASAAAPTHASTATTADPTHTKRGLPLANHAEIVALFRDPRYTEGRVIFIDARDDDHYAAGHIPGAYQFDHYHPDRYIATVLGAAVVAERVVVYCTGGECEDSELATLDLIALGVPDSKLVIYGGGVTAWKENHLPFEQGARGSGTTTQ